MHQSASYSPLRGTEPQNNRENRPRPRLPQSRWRAVSGGRWGAVQGQGGLAQPPAGVCRHGEHDANISKWPTPGNSLKGLSPLSWRVRELIAPPVPFPPVSGIYVFKCVGGLWGREAENAIIYLYRKALILASELISPSLFPWSLMPPRKTSSEARSPPVKQPKHSQKSPR